MVFPTEKNIKYFISLIKDHEGILVKHLPSTSDSWVKCMIGIVERCRLLQKYKIISEDDVKSFAAYLFIKIIMNHELSDGNKRSAVIMLYLFLTLNEQEFLLLPWGFRGLAKFVVENIDKGERDIDEMQRYLKEAFNNWLFFDIIDNIGNK